MRGRRRGEGSLVSLSIPDHRELAPGTLRKLIRPSSVSVEEFRSAPAPEASATPAIGAAVLALAGLRRGRNTGHSAREE
jgi:hypothetical protein